MEAQDLEELTGDLSRHVGDYLDTFYKVSLMNVTKTASNVSAAVISTIVVCVLGLFVLFFTGFAMAWWLGGVVNSRAGGFLIVAGFYLVSGSLIIFLRRKIILPYFRNMIIRKIYEQAN